MKKTSLFIAVILMSVSVFAQTRMTLLEEHFDGTSLPTGWQVMDLGSQSWSISDTQKAGGTANELKLSYNPSFNGTSRMVTPAVDLTGATSVVFSFKHCLDNYSGGHVLGVATTSDNGATWNVGWQQNYYSSGQHDIMQEITTPDMGQSQVRFCIFYTGYSYNINNWYFDDIVIFTLENLDLSLNSIDGYNTINAGATDISFTVLNKGVEPINSFKMSYQIDNEEPVEETFETTLATLESAQFTFATPVTLLPGSYELQTSIMEVNGANDNDPDNNTLTKNLNVALGNIQRIPMIEHFSSSTCGPCVSVNNQMQSLTNNNPGKFTYTKYQMNWPGNGDPYYTNEGGVRRLYYGVNAVPMVFLEGQQKQVNQAVLDNAYNTPAFGDIRGTFNVDGNNITVKVDFMAYYNLNVEKAFVTVNEKETHNNVGGNGETSFHHVFMKFLTDPAGDELNIPAGECQHFEYTYDMTSTHVEEMSDLEVAAWIQNVGTKEIINSHFMYEYTDEHPYPVANVTIENQDDAYRKVVSWEAHEGSSPAGYSVWVNNELVAENTTETSCIVEYTPGEFYVVEIQALYAEDKTSVKIAKGEIFNSNDNVAENAANSYNIYPNPADDNITVYGEGINAVEVYNICGQKVIDVKVSSSDVKIDMSGLTTGVYMVKVVDNNGNATVNKVVKR